MYYFTSRCNNFRAKIVEMDKNKKKSHWDNNFQAKIDKNQTTCRNMA